MTDDRSLLEAAARAAGIEIAWMALSGMDRPRIVSGANAGELWNPLANDGDALRLAVKLYIDLEFNNSTVKAIWVDLLKSETHTVLERGDEVVAGWDAKLAATRRCIVRAAAAIWRAS